MIVFSFTGITKQAPQAVHLSARVQTADQPDQTCPRRDEKVPKGVRHGAPRNVVHPVQVEKGLQPVRRLTITELVLVVEKCDPDEMRRSEECVNSAILCTYQKC